MARSRKTLKKRALEAFDRIRSRPDLRKLLSSQASDWSDKQVRDICAGVALTLAEGPTDAALRGAFKEAGLDPSDPFDWRRLLDTFADIHFSTHAPPAPRGARRKWDFVLFDRHVEWARAQTKRFLKRRGEPGPTHNDVALYLKIAWPQLYGRSTQENLRTYIIKRQPKG